MSDLDKLNMAPIKAQLLAEQDRGKADSFTEADCYTLFQAAAQRIREATVLYQEIRKRQQSAATS